MSTLPDEDDTGRECAFVTCTSIEITCSIIPPPAREGTERVGEENTDTLLPPTNHQSRSPFVFATSKKNLLQHNLHCLEVCDLASIACSSSASRMIAHCVSL